jgi:type II secretory pathway component GspD/PulD (secretin)
VITAAPGDKALVIDAPRQKIDRIVQLADSLDSEGEVAGRLTPRSYILTNANARDLAQSLSKLFAERRTRQDQNDKGNLEPEPRFEAEEASNLLLVAATSTQYEIIDKLIQQLETDSVDRQVQVRLFALKQARAADIEPTVEAALSTRAGLGTQDARQGARPGRISVSTDERTNVLIVTAPSSLMKEAETLITRLDTADGTESAVTTEVVTQRRAGGPGDSRPWRPTAPGRRQDGPRPQGPQRARGSQRRGPQRAADGHSVGYRGRQEPRGAAR